jgi:dTMP kinase
VTGLFIAFEGGEGAGKSTQVALAADWLRSLGRAVVETREPGGTPLGRQLRDLLLDSAAQPTPRAEALLYGADRAQHVESVIRPALAAGRVVLSDRYVDSTLAYQGAGRGLGDDARVVTAWATGGLLPDLTVLLDLDPTTGLARAGNRAAPDRLEAASLAFHEAVRQGFLALAAAEPSRYVVLDATLDTSALAARVRDAISRLLS